MAVLSRLRGPDVAAAMSPQLHAAVRWALDFIPTARGLHLLYAGPIHGARDVEGAGRNCHSRRSATVLVGIGIYAEPAGAIKVLGIVLVLASILIMNTDFSKLRNSAFVGHIVESMTFKPNAWWTEKSQDMDLFKERTGIALEPTVQESPWYFVR